MHALLSRRWDAIEHASVHIDPRPELTVRPEKVSLTASRRQRVLASLGFQGSEAPAASRVELHDVLGMGGMGVVHRGVQASLDRQVAVKAVRPDRRSEDATVKLLQEAWVAATLEHPNIIPIYDIGTGATGEPLIVQQRVEGTAWSDLIDDADLVRDRFGAEDLEEWNLRVLMQVSNAVHFAHARGVLHLDIKPSNVMIGAYGEVLLLDWGLAMALGDETEGRLPLAAENEDVIGTPAFMAPEMLAQGALPLDEHADVYLLGATLYRICAGHPPHQGGTSLGTLYKVATEEPARLTGVAAELASICHRAIATEQAERFPSAEAFRQALQDYLAHRGALRIAAEAHERAARLRTLLEPGVDPDPDEVRALFSAARFGLEHARSQWPDAPRLQEALRDLHITMARWELREDRPQAAQALLAAVDAPPPDLVQAVDDRLTSLAELGARVEKLQRYRDQQDYRVGMRTRTFIVGLLGIGFTALPLSRAMGTGVGRGDQLMSLSIPLAFLVVATLLIVWARDSMTSSAVNRRTIATAYVLLLGETLLTLVTQRLELSFNEALPLMMTFWAAVAALFAVHVDRRLLPTALGYVVAVACALSWPLHQWWFAAAAAAGFTINVGVIWWPTPVWRPRAMTEPSPVSSPDPPSGDRTSPATSGPAAPTSREP